MPLENFSGGIEELSSKIARIRNFTYIANHRDWLINSSYWQEKTLYIENNLSDQLHSSLISRFVDFSASYIVDTLMRGEEPTIEVDNKSFKLNGQNYGNINGFDLKLNDIANSNSLFLYFKRVTHAVSFGNQSL